MTDNDTMVAVVLKPCPWCGGEASADGHIRYSKPLSDTWWEGGVPITEAFYVNCIKCGAVSRSGLVSGYQTKVEAIERWNTRHQSDGCTGAVEALRKALAKIMPITFDDCPDYMSLYFGDVSGAHSTQAMTMHPQDWYDLQTAYEAALSQSTAGEDGT